MEIVQSCPLYKHHWDPFQPSMSNRPQGMKKAGGQQTVHVLHSKLFGKDVVNHLFVKTQV